MALNHASGMYQRSGARLRVLNGANADFGGRAQCTQISVLRSCRRELPRRTAARTMPAWRGRLTRPVLRFGRMTRADYCHFCGSGPSCGGWQPRSAGPRWTPTRLAERRPVRLLGPTPSLRTPPSAGRRRHRPRCRSERRPGAARRLKWCTRCLLARVRCGNEFQDATRGHVLLVDPHAEG
jgi:hypothetical protein